MEKLFSEITSGSAVGTGRDLSLQEFESNIEITPAHESMEAGHARTWWVEPVVDNGYSYINAGTCPDCGTGMVRQGNCFNCPSCGWGCCG